MSAETVTHRGSTRGSSFRVFADGSSPRRVIPVQTGEEHAGGWVAIPLAVNSA